MVPGQRHVRAKSEFPTL